MEINAANRTMKYSNNIAKNYKKSNEPNNDALSAGTSNTKCLPTANALAFMGIDVSSGLKVPLSMPQTKAQIGDTNVTVAGGDMTQIKADAYVVPEFDNCASEGGVGGAIIRGGALKGMEDYEKYIDENGTLEFGDVVLTESGGGNSKYLLHAVTAGADDEHAFEIIEKSVYDSLKMAEDKGIKSVVIPALGTGIIGTLTNSESANAILSGINKFADEGGKMDIGVVVYSTGKGFDDFADVLSSKSYEDATPVKGTKEFDPIKFATELTETSGASVILAKEDNTVCTDPIKIDEELIDKLKSTRTRFGMRLFSKKDIATFIQGCQEGWFHHGSEPTKNFKEKVIAVLSNPEEVKDISGWKSRVMGLARAIHDPLNSTLAANTGLFDS